MTNALHRMPATPGKQRCAHDDYRYVPPAGARIRARALLGLCVCIMALAWCSAAQAQTCTASMSPIAFGNYSPIGNAAATTSGTLTVSCTFPLVSLSTVRVCFNLGTGSTSTGSSLPPRMMGNGSNRLSYSLAQTSTPGVLWGATAAGTTPISITFAAVVVGGTLTRTIPITGTILPNQPTVPTVNNTTTTYTEDYAGTAATANYGFY
ncbi:MAG: spore coat protein U domain-containing protein, partial [Achromobacter sp.]